MVLFNLYKYLLKQIISPPFVFVFLAPHCDLWDLSSLTRDRTGALSRENNLNPLDCQTILIIPILKAGKLQLDDINLMFDEH